MDTLRTITNIGKEQPFLSEDGSPLVNAMITFTLVDADRCLAATFDTATRSLIVPKEVIVLTDENGEFTVDLWPTSRGEDTLFYLCRVQRFYSFLAALPEGDSPLAWSDFIEPRQASGTTFDDGSTITYDDGTPVT